MCRPGGCNQRLVFRIMLDTRFGHRLQWMCNSGVVQRVCNAWGGTHSGCARSTTLGTRPGPPSVSIVRSFDHATMDFQRSSHPTVGPSQHSLTAVPPGPRVEGRCGRPFSQNSNHSTNMQHPFLFVARGGLARQALRRAGKPSSSPSHAAVASGASMR